jgi:hypothetical protein
MKPGERNSPLIFLEKGAIRSYYQYDSTSPKKYLKNPKKLRIYNSVSFITGFGSQFGLEAK